MLVVTTNRKDSFTAMNTEPLGNNALVEIVSTSSASSVDRAQSTTDEELQNYGILRDYSVAPWHLTASSSLAFAQSGITKAELNDWLKALIDKPVRWEQYAESGQTFTEDGKVYALIPWWRLIGAVK